MLRILGQMEAPALILDHLYLGTEWNASHQQELSGKEYVHIRFMMTLHIVCFAICQPFKLFFLFFQNKLYP